MLGRVGCCGPVGLSRLVGSSPPGEEREQGYRAAERGSVEGLACESLLGASLGGTGLAEKY